MSDLATWIVGSAKVAAFASGPDGTVLAWNHTAEELLATCARKVRGAQCHDVVAGHDAYGNRYCGPLCPIRRMACRSETIRRFRLDLGGPDTVPLPVWVLVVVIGEHLSCGPSLIHLLEPVLPVRRPAGDIGGAAGLEETAELPPGLLTPDEVLVLGLIGSRVSLDVVAAILDVTRDTARTVLLGCLRKLEAVVSPGEARLAERLSPVHRRHVADVSDHCGGHDEGPGHAARRETR